ncbi:MFS transporter [Acinetobacter gerneri]|uniref:MFS transporter n=1 Tax=Acinetobacter gerneri TaxID=202952 RepID=A0AAW8JHS0_9GAMM|nr:MFS transporter [Acinetobacter gerneri]MDQ9008949.1 MFS transporter [Acinetobacter gerneri]MDQ9013053.1 MFS transporter [Acinetobacter gerneri]MDQ9024490.1 MFS transporter [Acinetobacter gerneri]MDQ9051725.1 MFS transporter [Acinetobacter gerneri]MDQ9059295.1 MFS transporter [Acinetobacter gerneri]
MDVTEKLSQQLQNKTRWTIALGFATQGLGYATVMTSLPSLKSRFTLNDDELSIIILAVCVAAALGSILADRLAVKIGSRFAIIIGFLLEACGVIFAALSSTTTLMTISFILYGIGLGCIDAALNMQAVILEQKTTKSMLGGFFACYTAAAFLGAMIMSAAVSTVLGATGALCVAAIFALFTAQLGYRWLSAGRERAALKKSAKTPLPHKNLVIYGLIILIAFTVDSAVSTWSSIYLKDVLKSSASIAPLGYAAYQVGILITRLVTDPLVKYKSAAWLAGICTVIGALGCFVVGLGLGFGAVIFGFLLAGVAVGALVPLTFSAAGRLDPNRRDEIIARVNIFNYGGAVFGAVVIGLLSGPIGYGPAFYTLAIALLVVLIFRNKFSKANEALLEKF